MKTLQEIKSELLHRCEDLYENYLVTLDGGALCEDKAASICDQSGNLMHEYNGFKQACQLVGKDLMSNIKRMEDRVHADRYIKSGIDDMLVNAEISGLPSQ
jgi:hypothetical protein